MKLDKSTLLAAALTVAFLYLLGLVLHLPGWIAVLVSIVVLLATALLMKEPVAKPAQVTVAAGPAGPPPVRRQPEQDPVFSLPPTRTIADVRLPSASPEFQFSFSAVVHWSTVLSGSRHGDLGSVAVDALLARAKAITAAQQPTEESLNQHRLAALLGEPDLDERGQVRTWATEVRLRLPDADSRHLQVLTALHRREQTALLERRMERDNRDYLKEDVLATPGSAAVWWLANNPGQVEKAVDLLGTLAQLSAAANADEPPDAERPALSGPHRASDLALAARTTSELAAILSDATQPAGKASSPDEGGTTPAPRSTGTTPAPRNPGNAPEARDTGTEPASNGHATDASTEPVMRQPLPNGSTEAMADSAVPVPRTAGAAQPDQNGNGQYREEFFAD